MYVITCFKTILCEMMFLYCFLFIVFYVNCMISYVSVSQLTEDFSNLSPTSREGIQLILQGLGRGEGIYIIYFS